MIFVWGTKVRRKPAGWVAEICSRCAEVRPHRLVQLREVPHVYYLGIGPGKVAGYEVACADCDASQGADPSRYAARLDAETGLARLVELTNPGVQAELEEQKQRVERALRGELGPEERVQVMQEALLDVCVAVEQRAASGNLDARTGLCLLAMLLVPCVVIAVAGAWETGEWGPYVFLGSLLPGLLATIHALYTRMPRFIRRTQGEAIQAALRACHPSPTELDQLLAGLRAAGTAFGKHTDRDWLSALFHSPEALSGRAIR